VASEAAQRSAAAMQAAFGDVASTVHVGRVSDEGARERP